MAVEGAKKKNRRPKNRSNKLNLVFDEEKRRDFLTGFHKRKLQRKQYAKDKLEKDLKEERKRLKSEAKESYKKLVVSHRDIPEVDKILERDTEEYEDEEVSVTVVELSPEEIAKENNWIGPNKPKYIDEGEGSENDDSGDMEDDEEVPGMSLKEKKKPKAEKLEKQFTSSKEIKSKLKKQATKKVQKSKVFQRKIDVERRKQKKKSLRQEKERSKFLRKHKKLDKVSNKGKKFKETRKRGKHASNKDT